jgi:hypothetical protein
VGRLRLVEEAVSADHEPLPGIAVREHRAVPELVLYKESLSAGIDAEEGLAVELGLAVEPEAAIVTVTSGAAVRTGARYTAA